MNIHDARKPTKGEALQLVEELRIGHYHCDESYYCCPQCKEDGHPDNPCDCAAPAHNAKADQVRAYIESVVSMTIGGILSREVK